MRAIVSRLKAEMGREIARWLWTHKRCDTPSSFSREDIYRIYSGLLAQQRPNLPCEWHEGCERSEVVMSEDTFRRLSKKYSLLRGFPT